MAICRAQSKRNFKPAPFCFFSIALVLFCTESIAGEDWFRPNAEFQIVPPLPSDAYNVPTKNRNVSFNLTECNYIRSTYPLFQKPLRLNDVNRTVTVNAPKSINISDSAIINSLVVSAWYYAWKNCFAWIDDDTHILGNFSGVRVVVLQQNKKIIDVGRTFVSSTGSISSSSFFHLLFEKRRLKEEADQRALRSAQEETQRALIAEQEAERQRQLRQTEEDQAAHWSNIKLLFWLACAAIAIWYGARHIPKALAYLLYVLKPHPANRIINRATQREKSVGVNGRELANALRNVPKGSTGKTLATRDLNEMIVRTNHETAYLKAAEVLARKTLEMEDARTIVDELEQRKDRS